MLSNYCRKFWFVCGPKIRFPVLARYLYQSLPSLGFWTTAQSEADQHLQGAFKANIRRPEGLARMSLNDRAKNVFKRVKAAKMVIDPVVWPKRPVITDPYARSSTYSGYFGSAGEYS